MGAVRGPRIAMTGRLDSNCAKQGEIICNHAQLQILEGILIIF